MMPILKRVLLSSILLGAGALTLLLSDLHSREGVRPPAGAGAASPSDRQYQNGVAFPAAAPGVQTANFPSTARSQPKLRPAKCWNIRQISYSESVMVEEAMRGFRDGLKAEGLTEGTDFTLNTLCAQGDMATLGALFDSAQTAGTDLYMVYGTPTLQTAVRKVQTTPVVFTVVADPVVAGAGKSDTDHQPNITGVYTVGPYSEMAELLRAHFPAIKRIGTLFCPAEANSVVNKDLLVREATRCGLKVKTVPVNGPGELADAALALCSQEIDAVVQVVDNLSASGFPAIGHAAAQRHLPVFACQGAAATQGAALVLTRDYFDAGRESALKAAQILRGESPAGIPLAPPTRTLKLVNLQQARECRLDIPEALLREAQTVAAASSR